MNIFITEWMHEDDDETYILRAFGIDTENVSVTLDIHNYNPYFYVELPQDWNSSKVSMFIYGLAGITKRDLHSYEIVMKKPLSKFTGMDTFKYIKLIFNNYADFKKYSYALSKEITISGLAKGKPSLYQRYESNISPMLRGGMHDYVSIGWITINKSRKLAKSEDINTAKYFSCMHKDISLCDLPGIPGLKYLSFDIEADSSHADFPIANKRYTKLAREIIIEFCRLNKEKNAEPIKRRTKQIGIILKSYLQLAFNNNYANNGVSYCDCDPAKIIGNFDLAEIIKAIAHGDVIKISQLIQANYSDLHDFTQCANQLILDCTRLKKIITFVLQKLQSNV